MEVLITSTLMLVSCCTKEQPAIVDKTTPHVKTISSFSGCGLNIIGIAVIVLKEVVLVLVEVL